MALPQTDEDWLTYLSIRHDAELPVLEDLNRYYEGTQPLSYMHPEVLKEVGDRIRAVIINWPQLIVDSIEERLDVEGFRLPDADTGDKSLWAWWQYNNMDEQTQLGHVDALTMKRYYVSIGANEDDEDMPIGAAESPLEMYADIDPRTRQVRAALRRVVDDDVIGNIAEHAASLYLPNSTIHYSRSANGQDWKVEDRDDHNLGVVPVVPVVNRARLSTARRTGPNRKLPQRGRFGMSELSAVIPLSDAACKIATDMMVAAEFLALPIRGLFGIGPQDLEDEHGNKLTAIQTLLRRLLTIPVGTEEGAQSFEFAGANLAGFHESLNSLARFVASLSGLPPDFLGFTTDNPASADAIRSAEARLVKRCERKQRAYGGSYEQVCRIVRRFQEDDWDPKLRRLEAMWRDPSTPTYAQMADAAVKLYATPDGKEPIVPLRQTREKLGFTDGQVTQMEKEDAKFRRENPLGEIARGLSDRGLIGQPAADDGDAA